MIKAKLNYTGNEKTIIEEVKIPQVPNINDGFNFRFRKMDANFNAFTIESIDYWFKDGVFEGVDLYLKDEV